MNRREVQIQIQTDSGPKTVTILDIVTIDDLVVLGMRAYVHEVRQKVPYESPFSRTVRDAVTRTRTAQRS